jgi:hypothetical protein
MCNVAHSNLKAEIEDMYHANGEIPVCILGHSMGVLCVHYFLHWVVAQTGSRQWADQHVGSFIAAGGPWLGAFKSTRATVFGDDMGLGLFVKPQQARPLCRAFGRYTARHFV